MEGVTAIRSRVHELDTAQNRSFPTTSKKHQINKPVEKHSSSWAPSRLQALLPRRSSTGSNSTTNIGRVDGKSLLKQNKSNENRTRLISMHSPTRSESTRIGENQPSPRDHHNAGTITQSPSPRSPDETQTSRFIGSLPETTAGESTHVPYARRGLAGEVVSCRVEKDGTVFVAVGAASQPLRIQLVPVATASNVGGGTDRREHVSGLTQRGAKIHAMLPAPGEGRANACGHLQKLVKEGDVLVEVNGRDVRGALFSEIIRLLDTTAIVQSSSQTNKNSRESVFTRAQLATGSATTSTSSTPLSNRSTQIAPPSPADRPRDLGETHAPDSSRSISLRNHYPSSFTNSVVNTTTPRRSLRGLGNSGKVNAILGAIPSDNGDECPSVSTGRTTPRSVKRAWSRLAPWNKGWSGGTPGKSPRLGWGGGASGGPWGALGRSTTPGRPRSTYSAVVPVLDEDEDVEQVPVAPPSPGGDSFPEMPRAVKLAPPSPEEADESGQVVSPGGSLPVTVLATPMMTLRFSTGVSRIDSCRTSSADKKKHRVGFSPETRDRWIEAAESKGFVRDEDRVSWSRSVVEELDGGRRGRLRSSTIDHPGKTEGRVSTGGGPRRGTETRTVSSEHDLEKLAEAASLELSEYLASTDRGWPWAGKEVIWADYVSLNGHHRWVRSEGCRHAFLIVQDAMYLLELPVEAVARASHERRKNRNISSPTTHRGGTRKPPPFQPAGGRGWSLKISASMLKFITVPLTTVEVAALVDGVDDVDRSPVKRGIEFAKNGGKLVKVSGKGVHVATEAKGVEKARERGGLILHGRGWACAWLECVTTRSRNSLVDVVSAWHSAETKGSLLKVDRVPQADASVKVRGGNGATMASMLNDRKSCAW